MSQKQRRVSFVSISLCLAILVALTAPRVVLAQSAVSITTLKTEYKVNPIGIDASRPRFSWQLTSGSRAQRQVAYQVLVASSQANIDASIGDRWDSGQVSSDKSNQIEYNGAAVASRTRYYWKVRVWDGNNVASAWSSSAFFEMGLLSAADWTARWIAEPTVTDKSPLLRKGFSVGNTVRRARVYATALGLYEIYLNGTRVSQDYFNPGWTVYTKRLPYQAYDVTSLIVNGNNAIGAVIGNGWYASDGWIRTPVAGTTRSVRVQLEIEFTDNTTQRIISDTSWRVWADGPIQSSWIYDGEVYDARKEQPGWSTASFIDSSWATARDVSSYNGALVAGSFPIRVMQNQTPIGITNPAAGTYIVDMGQNMVGWVRLSVQGAAGTTVRMRHAEMLNTNGTLYVDNLRGAAQTDTFILRGTGAAEVFEPHFTYHGFRYLELTGFPGTPTLGAITGRVAYAALDNTGSFTTSNAQLNKLYQNIVWGQRGNFYSVPTDCPQRDERMGWTGDGQVFAATGALNMDVSSYFSKWSQDIEDDQQADGVYTVTVPVASLPSAPSPAWQEVGVIIPWTVYQSYGDTRIIDQRWASMVRFISYLQSRATNNLQAAGGYGDWLSVGESVPGEILATAYYGYSVKLMAAMARATGRTAEAASYDTLFGTIRNSFANAYVGADGHILGNSQAGYAMALAMDMLPGERVTGAGNYLASNVRARGNHLTTGFVGTKDLNDALTRAGQTPVAYDLINQTTYPSWLFSVQNGATTIWERWDGWTPTGGFQDPGMNSFNHYSFGAVGKWMFNTVAGIAGDPLKPGYKGIVIRPQPGGGLTSTRGEYKSIYGSIISDWRVSGSTFTLGLTIPVNTTATLYLPTRNSSTVMEGGVAAGSAAGVTYLGMDGNAAVYSVGSGSYSFTADMTGTGPTPTPTAAPGTWTACASEAGTCTFTGTRQVRYGASGLYAYGTFTSSVACTNGVFGDPAPNVAKTCDYNNATATPTPTPTAGTWTFCANEFATCAFTGTRQVRYGAGGLYATGTFTNGVVCTNDVFGDPAPGVAKTCAYNAVPAATPTPTATPTAAPGTWTLCANEGGTCTFTGTRQVRYGGGGTYAYGTFTTSVACTNAVFGDPTPGVAKTCEYNTPPTVTPTATATPTPTPTARPTVTPTARPTATPTATTPTGGTATIVNLSSAFNVNAHYSNGTTFPSNGGIDGVGSAYSSTLLGTNLSWSGTTFNFGGANVLNGVRNTTITLPAGQYATLMLLGTGVNGDQVSQTVRVNYTDGTNQTFTQTFSNWLAASQNVAGQSVAFANPYRNKSTGVADNRVFNLYGYSFALTSTKTVASLVLPATNNVSILAATLRTAAAATPTATARPTATATARPTATATTGTGQCAGVPAFATCTAYPNGSKVVFNNSLYHTIADVPATRDCPPSSPFDPSTDNWWVNDGGC